MLEAKTQFYREGLQQCWEELSFEELDYAAILLTETREKNKNVFIIGNGGSASTASHMALDLNKVGGLRAISLTDASAITAWSNDDSYEQVFANQLKTLIQEEDVLIAISASGTSPNILSAASYANEKGAYIIGLIGMAGGKLIDLTDVALVCSSVDYGIIEDFHLSLNHILTEHLKESSDCCL
jgi:D-sedoheptulose 7-phosphate isomerase